MHDADQNETVNVSREFASLLQADADTWQHFGDLQRHLFEYPKGRTPGTSDILYWSEIRVSRRLVVSVTHLAISRTTDGPSAYAIASKQIYGTHYFDASLGLTVLVRDRSVSSPAPTRVVLESIARRYFRRAVRRHRADDCRHAGTLTGCHTTRTTAAINGASVCAPSPAVWRRISQLTRHR